MKLQKTPIAFAAFALCASLPFAAQAAPAVTIKTPVAGQVLSGRINGANCATDATSSTGLSRVTFWANSWQINNDYSSPFNCDFDTTRLKDGPYTFKAVAYDKNGTTTTKQVGITIKNSVSNSTTTTPTTTAPTTTTLPAPTTGTLEIWFKSPLAGATVSGLLQQEKCYVAGRGVSRVEFFLDSTRLNSDTVMTDGMSCVLDTTKFGNGTHALKAVAYNSSGASYTELTTINIQNVQNAPAAPTPSTGTGAVAASDILGQAPAEVPFAQHSGYTAQVLGTRVPAASIPETGVHGVVLPNGETLRLGKVADPADATRKVLAFQVHPSDAVTEGSKRAELSFNPMVEKDKVYWAALSVFVPDWGALSSSDIAIFGTQLHSGNDTLGLSPAFAIVTSGSGRNLRIDARHSTSTAPAQGNTISTKYAEQPIPFGRWVDFVFKFRLNTGTSGLLQVWMDGTQIADRRSAPLGFNTPGYNDYIKFGYYNWTSAFNSSRKVLIRSPMLVADPTGSKYSPADLRAALAQAPSSAANSAPTVSFIAPAAGATLSGTVNSTGCAVDAKDDVAVAKVEVYVGSKLVDSKTAPPYQCAVDTTQFANGTHTLMAVATDNLGASATTQRDVSIQNAGTVPPPATSSLTTPAALPSTNTKAVATFESLGLYWTPPSDPGAEGCHMRYRKQGESNWNEGFPLWYDARNSECRGSLVHLTPGTNYEVQFSLPGQQPVAQVNSTTWSENFPIAQTVHVTDSSQPLTITQGGSASGYVLYTPAPGASATIDVANAHDYNVTVSAPYVIVRGLTLKGAKQDGIRLLNGAHDVVIEGNDISGWGRYRTTNSAGWQLGMDMDAGVRAACRSFTTPLERVVIQRNRIHDPRYGANSWSWGHPAGPQGITFSYCAGNHVFRYNDIYSGDRTRSFNDGIGGEDNFSTTGFPIADTDIYGNRISNTWDDAIEAEGGNKNVRIWGNYIDQTATGVASTVVHHGPLYIFRNVYNRSRHLSETSPDSDSRNTFLKAGTVSSYGNGRRYVFHNTTLQATEPGLTNPLGAGNGLKGNTNQPLTNTVSRNNIFHVWKSGWSSIAEVGGSGNNLDYDLRNGGLSAYAGAEPNGSVGFPQYAPGHGWQSESNGLYQLAPTSPGYGGGAKLPNFNDAYAAPDIGAHQSGTPAMKFGTGSPISTGGTTTTTTTTTSTTDTSGTVCSTALCVAGQ